MRLLLTSVFLAILGSAIAQPTVKDTSITLDILRAPVSPAAALAGIAPSEVEKPTDPTAFMISLQQATNNFSQLPKSYAIDFTPGLIFNSQNLTIDKYLLNTFKDNIRQSLTFSVAIRNLDIDEEDSLSRKKTKLALGVKVSILRGHLETQAEKLLKEIGELQSIIINQAGDQIDSVAETDTVYQNARANMRMLVRGDANGVVDTIAFRHWQSVAVERKEKIAQDVLTNYSDVTAQLRAKAADFKIRRVGWKLDVAGGLALDFIDQRFSNSYVAKAGGWVTGGYEGEKGFTFLGIGRYLFNPDKIFADESGVIKSAGISTLDFGGRIVYSYPQSRFSLSSEAIYRSVLNNKQVPSTWRLTLNADYDIGRNRKLTFAFGRDFDGTVSKAGNVIAALQLLAGFGSRKTIK